MIFLYDLILFIYSFLIQIAAFFGNEKARLWHDGRKDIFNKIELELNKNKDNKTYKTIWFHVSSLGEFEQGRPIIEALKDSKFQIPDSKFQVVLTFFSPSGYEMRKNYPFADHIFYLPIDTRRNARRFLALIKPDLVVFVKYEFWFHYLTQLQKLNIPILLVSAIFREKQFSKLNPYAPLLMRILKNFTKIFLQDTPSVNLLKKHNFSNIILSGDTRVDRVAAIAEEGKKLPIIANFVGNKPCFIGGSTWEADEKQMLTIFNNPKFKDWQFIFAPHDISANNINRLEKLLPEKAIKYSDLINKKQLINNADFNSELIKNNAELNKNNSELNNELIKNNSELNSELIENNSKLNSELIKNNSELNSELIENNAELNSELIENKLEKGIYTEGSIYNEILQKNNSRILIIDNIGLLSALYRYGKIAYIGGGFGSGIHNTLEPIAHGLPVLFGPKYEKFTEANKLVETGGGFVINDNQSVENQSFEAIMERLLIKGNYDNAALAASNYIAQNRGATLQVVEEITKIIGQ